ncbi:diacylglycerol kinase theta [Neolamprologus brichardi]|uniref:diacylglycerol kinase theta n=1 Tax=Neolamprologus brichardi TaxID=32507 RepID=UPI001643B381|nr:diacylglycerol kinase theta [Neolamprologus brichardi]
MADSGRPRPADPDAAESRTASPLAGKKRAQQSPGLRSKYQSSAPGHCFKKVTLTKPTFCHSCSDFIWGIIGFLCEVCNFMCHEKCLKTLRKVCSSMTPSLVQVPVAHCFGPAGQKKRFCCVCRKQTEGSTALRCEVCELHVHADCAIFTCADCRSCHLDGILEQDTFHHHWREGNLASAARCEVCRRSCGSSDVLAGMRCEWCGITSHAACYLGMPAECTLGRLRCMLLHPACVRLDSRNFSKMHCYRIAESCSHELDNSDDADLSAAAAPASKDGQPAASESGKQFLKVFDGDDAVKRGVFRLVSITKNEEVVEAALRAFYLPDDPQDFELHEIGGLQRLHSDDILNRNGSPDNRNSLKDGGDSWLLRAKPRVTEVIKVYTDWPRSGVAFISVSVSDSSTTSSVLAEVLSKLDRQEEDLSKFSLLEVCMSSKQVQRQTLTPQEKLRDKLREIRKVSLRQMNQTRFYIVENKNRAVRVELLIGGLPPLLTTEKYTQLIEEHLAIKSHLVTISNFYLNQGESSVMKAACWAGLRTHVVFPGLLLLRSPSVVFALVLSHEDFLCPYGLHTFREVPRFRVLVCGGDGTVGWVLGVLEAVRHKLTCREPPIGIVPLGTGNDLARILRWGPGYSGEDPYHILVSVYEADEVLMDRWTILLDAQDVSEDGKDNDFLEPPKIVQMNNYFGLGIDAELSLDFHLAREDEPDKFTSRFHNKGVYVKVGLQKISHTRSLHKELQLHVDGQEVPLPNIEGLIFLNIPSWGSGADLWGSEVDSRYEKPSIDDGLLEVVGVTGVVHMGQVQSGFRSGIRIAQGNYIRLTLRKPIPVQVDGEPWIQPPGHIIISAAGPKVRMLRKSKQKQKKSSANMRDGHSDSPSSRDGH